MLKIVFGAGERRQIHDGIDGPVDVERLGHILLKQGHTQMREVRSRPGNEIINAKDLMAFRQQPFTQMRTDEPGGPRYEYAHFYQF
jgi:hypothetical protein